MILYYRNIPTNNCTKFNIDNNKIKNPGNVKNSTRYEI